jgi:alkylation response protein AidB-like acyl-CoA dehydrogenase
VSLRHALDFIAAGSAARECGNPPPFPEDAIALLESQGVLAFNAVPGLTRPPAAQELELVRTIARADGSVARIVDGHLNAVERIAVQGPAPLRARELAEVVAGRLRAGVWGADPVDDEGPPARLIRAGQQAVLRGVKTFCSGAGGLHRALVLARHGDGPSVAAWVDLDQPDAVEIDEQWFRGSGLRASTSHRVVFHDAPILTVVGSPGALARQPWFARDALRTAATWAGMADTAVDAGLDAMARQPARGELQALAAGRLHREQRTIGLWLDAAARAMDAATATGKAASTADLVEVSVLARDAIAGSCRALIDEIVRACGSHPLASGSPLDRVRRDLELFLNQHRLDPLVARAGAAALEART